MIIAEWWIDTFNIVKNMEKIIGSSSKYYMGFIISGCLSPIYAFLFNSSKKEKLKVGMFMVKSILATTIFMTILVLIFVII